MANRKETMGTVRDFIFLGSKITADNDCSHEIKRRLLLRKKASSNIDSLLKTRDITLPTKICLVKAQIFPVVMYGCKSWTIKKADHWRIDAFELWCWKRLLRVPWIARRSNQSILNEISPEYSIERLTDAETQDPILWPPDEKNWLDRIDMQNAMMLRKIEGRRTRGRQRMRQLHGITDSMDMSVSKL